MRWGQNSKCINKWVYPRTNGILNKWWTNVHPKDHEAWGVKYLFRLGWSLEEKLAWNLILKEGLWQSILKTKYLGKNEIVDSMSNLPKRYKVGLVYKKSIMIDFLIVSDLLSWKIDDGLRDLIGEEATMWCGTQVFLS